MVCIAMNNAGLSEFIDIYRESRCLWDPGCSSYSHKFARISAQEELLKVIQKYDSSANLASVRKKIDSLRTIYFRELKKVQTSQITGLGCNGIYVPTLWYYDKLSFLSEVYRATKSGADEDDANQNEDEQRKCDDDYGPPPPKVSKKKQFLMAAKELARMPYSRSTDSWAGFGISVGGDLRKLDSRQQTLAQKLISDVIFAAKLGRLSEESALVNPSISFPSPSPSPQTSALSTSSTASSTSPTSPNFEKPKHTVKQENKVRKQLVTSREGRKDFKFETNSQIEKEESIEGLAWKPANNICEKELVHDKNDRISEKPDISCPLGREKIFICYYCGFNSNRRRLFVEHVESHQFVDTLKKHTAVHDVEKLYACGVSSNKTKRSWEITKHEKPHYSENSHASGSSYGDTSCIAGNSETCVQKLDMVPRLCIQEDIYPGDIVLVCHNTE